MEADENLACAKVLSLILGLWFYRVAHAKAFDPRRRPQDRKKALRKLWEYHHLLLDCVINESMDGVLFSDPEWDFPFSPKAKYKPDTVETSRQIYFQKMRGKGK